MESPPRPPPRLPFLRATRRRRTRSILLAAAAVAASLPSGPAGAAPRPRAAPAACAPAPGDAAVALASVSDEGDVALADGRVVRLAGIDPGRATPAAPDRPARLRASLLGWAAGPLALHPLGEADRWGRVPALLFRADPPVDDLPEPDRPEADLPRSDPSEADPPREAGSALLAAGLARAAPEAAVHACAEARLAAEGRARTAVAGLWADPAYAVLAPGDAAGLAAQAGGLAIVRGILRLHESRGALYLSLGRDRRGFAAVVSRRAVKFFARSGLDLRDYAGTPVRLRGDLDARFGPRMRLTDPDAVESLEPGSVAEGE